jgi:anti-sigma regulatory factor (Ser/Thr protein kinase)
VVHRREQDFPARPDVLARARQSVRELLAGPPGVPSPIAADIELAVTEALTNAITHAYRGMQEGRIAFAAARANGRLTVNVRDFGRGMRPRPDSPGLGLGLSLMSALSESLVFERCRPGTHVTMTFALDAPGAPSPP